MNGRMSNDDDKEERRKRTTSCMHVLNNVLYRTYVREVM